MTNLTWKVTSKIKLRFLFVDRNDEAHDVYFDGICNFSKNTIFERWKKYHFCWLQNIIEDSIVTATRCSLYCTKRSLKWNSVYIVRRIGHSSEDCLDWSICHIAVPFPSPSEIRCSKVTLRRHWCKKRKKSRYMQAAFLSIKLLLRGGYEGIGFYGLPSGLITNFDRMEFFCRGYGRKFLMHESETVFPLQLCNAACNLLEEVWDSAIFSDYVSIWTECSCMWTVHFGAHQLVEDSYEYRLFIDRALSPDRN